MKLTRAGCKLAPSNLSLQRVQEQQLRLLQTMHTARCVCSAALELHETTVQPQARSAGETDARKSLSTTELLLGAAATLEQQYRRTCFCRGWLIASLDVVAGLTRSRGLRAASGLLLWWAAVHVAVLLRDSSILPADLDS
jgi:hypothetical protein